MDLPSLADRIALARRIRSLKQSVAHAVTEEFLARHPDWLARDGDQGRLRGIEDATFHLDFLAGAIEGGTPEAFADYVRWAGGVLSARHVAPRFLAESLGQIEEALITKLSGSERTLVTPFWAAAQTACAATAVAPVGTDGAETQLARTRSPFLQAILRGDRQAAVGIALEALREEHPLADVYAEVFQPALYEVGRLWETNRITVAEEHMATAVTQYVMAQAYGRIERPAVVVGRAVITGVEGELHQVGANMVADVLEAYGWDVRFLGSDVPRAGVLRVLAEHRADVLGVSMTMLSNVPHLRTLLAAVRETFRMRAPKVIVGGGAFRHVPELWRELGADGYGPELRAVRALLCAPPAGAA